jgi:hypothetical protein
MGGMFGGGASSPSVPPTPPPPPPPADTEGAAETMDSASRAERSRRLAAGRASTILSDSAENAVLGGDSTASAKKTLLGS